MRAPDQTLDAITFLDTKGLRAVGVPVDSGGRSANNPARYTLISLGLAVPSGQFSSTVEQRQRARVRPRRDVASGDVGERYKVMAGLAFEPSPVPTSTLEPGFPRGDAMVYAVGFSYDLPDLSFDLGVSLHDHDDRSVRGLELDAPVSRYLPEFFPDTAPAPHTVSDADDPDAFHGPLMAANARITIRQLLTHTSGLPDWRPLYRTTCGRKGYARAIADEPLVSMPGARKLMAAS